MMPRAHRHVILLTACINPNGMANTAVQDADLRKRQYIDAIDFYLRATSCPIVVCENTMCDLTEIYRDHILSGRLEFLTFDGNGYDKSLGKGYGEALIMLYALDKSVLLNNAKYVVKITGRLIIDNIARIISSHVYWLNNVFRCNFASEEYCRTMIFVFSPQPFYEYLKNNYNKITDAGVPQIAFENVVADYLKDVTALRIIPFVKNPAIRGIRGQTGTPYQNKDSLTNLLDNLYHLSALYSVADKAGLSKFTKGMYYLLLAYSKLYCRWRRFS